MTEVKPEKSAVFLDRDGTLILDKDYLHKPEEVEYFVGALEAMKRLQDAGFVLIMVTNQSGVGRGYFTMQDVENVHARIRADLATLGVTLAAVYTAPEAPDQPSRGRKPSPAFLHDARDAFGLDLARSYMVGDKLIDLEAGWNAGVRRSLLVRTGYGSMVEKNEAIGLKNAVVVDAFAQAAEWMIEDFNHR